MEKLLEGYLIEYADGDHREEAALTKVDGVIMEVVIMMATVEVVVVKRWLIAIEERSVVEGRWSGG